MEINQGYSTTHGQPIVKISNTYNLCVGGFSVQTVRRHIPEDFCVMSLNFAIQIPGMAVVTAHDISIFCLLFYSPR